MFPLIALGHSGHMGLTTYMLVRDADGAILAEFRSAEAALRTLAISEDLGAGVSVVRCDDAPGAVLGTSSLVTARLANFPTAADRA
jgi:hypothetical protein